jgi:AcrR family transcriptional regulator
MDDIAAEAGVGKGTLFRRFGNRAGLMVVLLDEDEQALQREFLFGPPPLGPAAAPLDRLLAYGRARLAFVCDHRHLLQDAARGPQTRYNAPHNLNRMHVRVLLEAADTTGDLDAQAEALLALLDADYIAHQLEHVGVPRDTLADGWESVARKLCGR